MDGIETKPRIAWEMPNLEDDDRVLTARNEDYSRSRFDVRADDYITCRSLRSWISRIGVGLPLRSYRSFFDTALQVLDVIGDPRVD